MAHDPENEADETDAPSEPKADASSEPKAEPSAKKPKRKKAKSGASGRTATGAPELDDGQFGATKKIAELPGAGTPEGDELRDAWAAFEVGDYRKARELATRLEKSDDADVRKKANEILGRTGVDQVQIAFLVACTLAILTIAWIYIPH